MKKRVKIAIKQFCDKTKDIRNGKYKQNIKGEIKKR